MITADQTVVITGASRGIGRSAAVAFAGRRTNPLVLIARSEDGLKQTRKMCLEAGSRSVEILPCDLTSEADVNRAVKHPAMQRAAVLLNNAGYYLQKPAEESGPEEYLSQFESNALSSIRLTQKLLPILKTQQEARLIFICSVTAQRGQARCGAYSSSKHALNGYIQSIRESLTDSRVGVTSVILGQTWSTSWEGSGIDPERLVDPTDIGSLFAWICDHSGQTCVEEVVIRPQKGDL
jgi:short-subunit dehydrogenase